MVNQITKHGKEWMGLKRTLIKEGVRHSDISRMDVFEFFALLEVMQTEKK